jgi:hypothetical protein
MVTPPPPSGPVLVEISPGDIYDRITILRIKERRISQAAKLVNVRKELAILTEASAAFPLDDETGAVVASLQAVNERLWQIEDDLRDCEIASDFGPRFIHLARSVYQENDQRAALKRRLNVAFASTLIEEKSYAQGSAA